MGTMNTALIKENVKASLRKLSKNEIRDDISVFHRKGVSLIEDNNSGYDKSDVNNAISVIVVRILLRLGLTPTSSYVIDKNEEGFRESAGSFLEILGKCLQDHQEKQKCVERNGNIIKPGLV